MYGFLKISHLKLKSSDDLIKQNARPLHNLFYPMFKFPLNLRCAYVICFSLTVFCYFLCIQDLLDALNQLEAGLKDSLKKLSSFDKYKQQVLLGHLDWSPMHKDPMFWRENINNFEENDFQVCLVFD
jgi:hypothetical protein